MAIGAVLDARKERIERIAEECAAVVFGGGTVIFPNETSYGIACDPNSSDAVDRVYRAKHRSDERPLTLHVATPAEFLEFAPGNGLALLASKRLLPGPVIVIVRKPAFISDGVTAGMTTLGFRVPDEPVATAILQQCGPLAVTSANRSGSAPYRGGVRTSELPEADLLIENGPTRFEGEASIVDCTLTPPRLLREGLMSFDHIAQRLGSLERRSVRVRS